MATKKTTAAETEEVKTTATETEEAKAAEAAAAEVKETIPDEWEETKEVTVPRRPKGDAQQYYICVNDRRYVVPADGKRQTLPKPIAEILEASIEAEYAADDFAEKISGKGE